MWMQIEYKDGSNPFVTLNQTPEQIRKTFYKLERKDLHIAQKTRIHIAENTQNYVTFSKSSMSWIVMTHCHRFDQQISPCYVTLGNAIRYMQKINAKGA